MDPRRPSRSIIDPKVRHVGFFTPPSRTLSDPSAAPSAAAASLSPVMIPPPRHLSLDPSASPIRRDVLLGTPSTMSPSALSDDSRPEFFDDMSVASSYSMTRDGDGSGAPKVAASSSSLPVISGSLMRSSLTTASVVKTLPGMSEKERETLEMQNEGFGTQKQKMKPSKAERRAIQEAERAAKAAAKEAGAKHSAALGAAVPANAKQGKPVKPIYKKEGPQGTNPAGPSEKKVADRPPEKDRKKDVPHPRMQFDDIHRVEKAKRRAIVNQSEASNRVELFRHLPQYIHGTQFPDLESKFFQLDPVHPSVFKVGLQYLSGDISGANARCIAMLLAFKEAIRDYSTPSEKVLARDLTAKISTYVSFLIECRPLSISMGNAIKFLKNRIAKLPHNMSESDSKSSLQSDIERFINEKIVIADKVIVRHAVTKIRDGDVLLIYGSSSVVEMILLYAHELGKKFRVVVVDSRPKLEGQPLLRRLLQKGINCTYTHINAISYIMHEVTRVFLGAASVLSNGTVYSRVGTACVAMVAYAFQVPVLICCEAYKFHERVQLDSICSNELGDPDVIAKVHGRKDLNHLDNWSDKENLQLLNLTYDATPADYTSMIITDYGMLPPTSVPVIVREYRRENLWI